MSEINVPPNAPSQWKRYLPTSSGRKTGHASDSPEKPLPLPKPTPLRHETYACAACKDLGWLYATDHLGEVVWQNGPRIVRCACKSGVDRTRQRERLEALDGLNPTERAVAFADLDLRHNPNAVAAVQHAAAQRRGLITLTGAPGRGKSTLLMAAVNAARTANVLAVYTTTTDLLDHLRRAYAPDAPESFDARWSLLVDCEVLALDELSEFRTTEWALERFLRLVDERWRRRDRLLTLCALNGSVSALPEKVASGLEGASAIVLALGGPDMRRGGEPGR